MSTETGEHQFRRGRISMRLLLALMAIIVASFAVICGRTLIEMRRAAFDLARQAGQNLAGTMDADISRNIELYDLSLRAAASYVTRPEVLALDPAIRQLVLFDHAATASQFGPIQVMDANGNVYVDSTTVEPVPANHSEADYFRAHALSTAAGLYIGPPIVDDRGEYAVPLSRRIALPDGSFGGVVAGSIKIRYFHDLFRRLTLDPEDSITLVNRAGIIIMRLPFEIEAIGRDISHVPGIPETLSSTRGAVVRHAGVDGVERLFVWENGFSPLVVMPGRALQRIYAPWRQEATAIGAAMAALIAMMIVVSVVLLREMKQRAALQMKLAALATTDGLTGLANRRQFDRVLRQEWSRAQRAREPLALVMLDADRFKRLNDTYGHQAGDQVLKQIASCIAAVARRSADCAARYGGEEFAVVLPGMSIDEAHAIAERIRRAVGVLVQDPCTVTVSAGVAALVPGHQLTPDVLIEAADAALYRAKQAGRDRTELAAMDAAAEALMRRAG